MRQEDQALRCAVDTCTRAQGSRREERGALHCVVHGKLTVVVQEDIAREKEAAAKAEEARKAAAAEKKAARKKKKAAATDAAPAEPKAEL